MKRLRKGRQSKDGRALDLEIELEGQVRQGKKKQVVMNQSMIMMTGSVFIPMMTVN